MLNYADRDAEQSDARYTHIREQVENFLGEYGQEFDIDKIIDDLYRLELPHPLTDIDQVDAHLFPSIIWRNDPAYDGTPYEG